MDDTKEIFSVVSSNSIHKKEQQYFFLFQFINITERSSLFIDKESKYDVLVTLFIVDSQ
jgi:hypothetical protein